MALFATSVSWTSAWAESAVVEPLVITLSENAVYEQWPNTLFEKSVVIGETNRVYADVILTSGEDNKNAVSATFTNSTNPAFYAPYVTLQNLDALSFDNIDSTAIYGHLGVSILNNNSLSISNVEYVQDNGTSIGGAIDNGNMGEAFVLVQDNGSVSFVGNKAIVTEGGSAEGAVVRADNVYLYNNGSVSVKGNVSSTGDGDCIGGAISAGAGSFELSGTNGHIDISGNSALSGSNHRVLGGAIMAVDMIGGIDGVLSINNNSGETISIKSNTAKSGAAERTENGNNDTPIYVVAGGALLGMKEVEIAGNTSTLIEVSNNKAISENSNDVYGGAIASFGGVSIVDNKPSVATTAEGDVTSHGVVFDSNEVSSVSGCAYGGAIGASNAKFDELGLGSNADEVLPNVVELSGNGDITFSNNSAISGIQNACGGAIYSDGNVILTDNGNVTYTGNKADGISAFGAAIYGADSVLISDNDSLTFSDNSVTSGEVDADGNVINTRAGNVGGAAIYSKGNVTLGYVDEDGTTHGNGIVTLTGNKTAVYENDSQQFYDDVCGGAIYAEKELTISGNTSVNISFNGISSIENTARGGAIYSKENINICNNGAVAFNSNKAISTHDRGYGGAICSDGYILMDNNTSLTFDNNSVHANSYYGTYGGTIFSTESITFSNNGDIKFSNNKIITDAGGVISYGTRGAAISADGDIYIGDENGGNNNVSFIGNEIINEASGPVYGGAIGNRGSVSLCYNNEVTFENNKVQNKTKYAHEAGGGAISAENSIYIESNNGKVLFKNNVAQSGGYIGSTGGAIETGSVMMINNGQGVYFEGNKALAVDNYTMGGAIACSGDVTLGLNNGVSFSNNVAINYGTLDTDSDSAVLSMGGAIMSLAGGVLATYNTGDINFSYNGVAAGGASSFAWGGAIITQSLSIGNNSGNVTFAGNFESGYIIHSIADLSNGVSGEHKTILRSICVTDGEFMLAANKDTSITFYDSIYVASSDSPTIFNFYPDYLSEDGSYIASSGNIVFSGARTEKDLAVVEEYLKSQNFDAAAGDIEASRTSTIERDVIVAAGSLQVIDGAKLCLHDGTKGYSLILVDGTEMGPSVGIEYTPELSAKLVVSGGSCIVADSITFGSTAQLITVESMESLAAFDLREAATPTALLQANTITLMGGMTYTQDGAYTMLVGDSNTLTIDVSNGLAFTLNLDDSVAYTEGDMTYFVLFTDIETLNLVGADSWDEVGITYNLSGDYIDPTVGYDVATGTLYVAAKGATVPEPTTATLSLLALAALAARRRRR